MSGWHYERDGQAIYRQSFAIIRAEADLSAFDDAEAEVAVRMIHACGLVEAVRHFRFAPGLVSAAAPRWPAARRSCATPRWWRAASPAPVPADNRVICTLRDTRTADLASRRGTTRSAAAMELWGDDLAGALVVIGNAPTALFHLFEMLADGAPKPAAIIGMPVGFVGAAESKQALAEGAAGAVPWATVSGRMGGSAIAAAAVNALARPGI